MANLSKQKHHLCIIEQLGETSGCKKEGTLCLMTSDESFQLCWKPNDNTPSQRVSSIFSSFDEISNQWKIDTAFALDCQTIELLTFSENESDHAINISIKPNNKISQNNVRTFKVIPDEFLSLSILIEQLLLNGIAVPSPAAPYSLEFYSRCHNDLYNYIPPQIQLNFHTFTTLSNSS